MYSGQTGQVKTDCNSREFEIGRGTEQGDPLSTLLFNALLADMFREVDRLEEEEGDLPNRIASAHKFALRRCCAAHRQDHATPDENVARRGGLSRETRFGGAS